MGLRLGRERNAKNGESESLLVAVIVVSVIAIVAIIAGVILLILYIKLRAANKRS